MKLPKMPKMRWADVASLLVVVGLGAQGLGLHMAMGPWALIIVGTEVAVMGLVGVWNAG